MRIAQKKIKTGLVWGLVPVGGRKKYRRVNMV
jgi:hypothetical protein